VVRRQRLCTAAPRHRDYPLRQRFLCLVRGFLPSVNESIAERILAVRH
jgi:hypothetical protein